MGKVLSVAMRPIRNFNVENRAQRVISQEKPVPAPRYPSNIEDMENAIKNDPNLVERLNTKDLKHDNRLRDVYVTSEGRPEADETLRLRNNHNRPLPLDRGIPIQFEYGMKEPDVVRAGHMTLKSALTFITLHQLDPEKNTKQNIAKEYNLKEQDVADILEYFRTFHIYIPDKSNKKGTFAKASKITKIFNKEATKVIEDVPPVVKKDTAK